MSPHKSTLATISWQGNSSTFKYSRQLWVHNWNHNNKYASLSNSRAAEQDQRLSTVTGHSCPQLEMKRHSQLKHENITETTQLVSPVQKTAAPYFPPTILNFLHSQGHTENDSLRQQSPSTNRQDNTVNASSRQDTPSTLNKWSSLSEERPSYSKFTLGLSPSIFHSFLFPQQVTYQKHKSTHTSSHSLKYSHDRRDDFDKRIRFSASSYDKPDYTYKSTRSSTSSHDEKEDPDTSFGSSTSSYDESEDPETFRRSSTSSCDEEEPNFSPTVRYHVDSSTLFGDLNPTPPPPAPRQRRVRKVVRRPPTPSSVGTGQHGPATPSSVGSKQKRVDPVLKKRRQVAMFKSTEGYIQYLRDKAADTPGIKRVESGYLKSPYGDRSTRATPQPPTPSTPHGGACCRMNPPFLKLSSSLSEESPTFITVKKVTDAEFQNFITQKKLAAIMFYEGTETPKDILQVWEREATQKVATGDRNYGMVDCERNGALCDREKISAIPFYKLYVGGKPLASGKHFNILQRNRR